MTVDKFACEFCGSVQSSPDDSCVNCGAHCTEPAVDAQRVEFIVSVFAHSMERVQQQFVQSRLRLTAIALFFAVLTGVFWQQAQNDLPTSDRVKFATDFILRPENSTELPQNPMFEQALTQARFGESLVALGYLRVQLAMEYAINGEWPNSFADIGVDESDLHDGKNINSVQLGAKGQIYAQLSDDFGKDARVSLVGKEVMSGSHIQWSCTTNVKLLSHSNSSCEFSEKIQLAKN